MLDEKIKKTQARLSFFQQFNLTSYVIIFFTLFILQTGVGGGVIYFTYLSQEESAIDSLLNRVQRDIKFNNGNWDLSEYNADSLIPGRFRLYIFAADGYVVDRWRPIPGFMDLTDIKYLLTFQEIQSVSTITGQNWRIRTRAIENGNDDIRGVITVAHNYIDESLLESIDQRLNETMNLIHNNITIEDGKINTQNISRRVIPFDISFQVVDQFNQILIYNSNINSMNRVPGYIDPSYVRQEMETPNARQMKDRFQNTYMVKSRPLSDNDQQMGVVIVTSSITTLYSLLKMYVLICGVISLVLASIAAAMLYKLTKKVAAKATKNKDIPEKKLFSLNEITSLGFDKKNSLLKINDQIIPITYATNQYYMCQTLFGSPKKKWEPDELIEKFGEELTKDSWRKVYDAMAGVNAKAASLMQPKLIVVSNKTYQINPQLLSRLS